MKKGFILIELFVVIAIIGILSSVVLASIDYVKKKSLKATTVTNSKADKFNSTKTVPVDTNIIYEKPTINQACGGVSNLEYKAECEKEYRRQQNFENCINRYSN